MICTYSGPSIEVLNLFIDILLPHLYEYLNFLQAEKYSQLWEMSSLLEAVDDERRNNRP